MTPRLTEARYLDHYRIELKASGHSLFERRLVVFPTRPGVTFGRSCDLPFEKYKHLLSDRPTRPPYRGPERTRRTGTQRRKPSR
jgi:hypothetical protein